MIAGFVAVVYHTALDHGFIMDDFTLIHSIKNGFSLYGTFIADFFAPTFYRPVTNKLLNYVAYTMFGLDPRGYHAIAVMGFVLLCLLLYRFVGAIAGRRDAALVAAIFFASRVAFHFPLYWIAGGFNETFTVLFILAAVHSYLLFTRRGDGRLYLASVAFSVLALMSKELSVVIPLLIVLVEVGVNGERDLKKIFIRAAPFGAVTLVYLSRLLVLRGMLASGGYSMSFTAATLIANLAYFWDNAFNGRSDLLVFLLFGGIALLSRRRLALTALAWYLVALLPVIFLREHVQPYYLCLPIVGMSLAFALGAGRIIDAFPPGRPVLVLGIAVLFAFTASAGTAYFENHGTLWEHEKNFNNAMAALGSAYPDGSLIYIEDPDEMLFQSLGYGSYAINLYYGDSVSVYFENLSAGPPACHGKIFYYTFNQSSDELTYVGAAP